METKISLKDFLKREKDNNVKLTKPQQFISDRLRQGFRLVLINKHHANGGTIMWKSPYSANLQHAGHIYKALQHYEWKVLKGTEIHWVKDMFIRNYKEDE